MRYGYLLVRHIWRRSMPLFESPDCKKKNRMDLITEFLHDMSYARSWSDLSNSREWLVSLLRLLKVRMGTVVYVLLGVLTYINNMIVVHEWKTSVGHPRRWWFLYCLRWFCSTFVWASSHIWNGLHYTSIRVSIRWQFALTKGRNVSRRCIYCMLVVQSEHHCQDIVRNSDAWCSRKRY